MNSGILEQAEWDKLTKCLRPSKQGRCYDCDPCRIVKHHDSVVMDLKLRLNHQGNAVSAYFRRILFLQDTIDNHWRPMVNELRGTKES